MITNGQNSTVDAVDSTANARGSVLLVEDDDLIRSALEILLSERVDVVAAASAEVALEGFVAGRFDVLVTDLGLPGRNGDELRRALCEVDPGLTALLITADDLLPSDPRLDGFDAWWQKPLLELDSLLDRVQATAQRNRLRRAG